MSTCLKHSTVVGCWNKADNTKENVVIHYTYATNASGVEILKAIRYTVSDGTPITLGVGDTVTPGACVVCRKEIFATHDRYITVPSAPAGFVAYEMVPNINSQGLDINLAYFHLIYPTLNGNQTIAYGPQLTDYFANPQNGILFNDIAGIQAVIDFVLPLMNLSVGDVIYAINTSNLPIFLLSPTAVTELANNTYLHIYWGDNQGHLGYFEKSDVTVIAANPNILLGGANKCVGIQEIKEKDTCTSAETYRYIIEDGAGNLVDASTVIAGFDEANVLLSCPSVEEFDIKERDVCITIDGSVDSYEVIKVYKRSKTTGLATLIHYETKGGDVVTGTIVEVCCTCDTLCTVAPALPLLSSVTAYARSLTGQNGCGDKFVIGAGIQWQVKIYQNGALILNSATSPILTSEAAAFTWLDSNAGGYWLNTTTLPWAFANNTNTYQFVSPTDPDEYLMVLTETGNGASYCGGNLTSYRWAFTNRGISLGTSCDNADAFAWSDLWADRTGWDWKC